MMEMWYQEGMDYKDYILKAKAFMEKEFEKGVLAKV